MDLNDISKLLLQIEKKISRKQVTVKQNIEQATLLIKQFSKIPGLKIKKEENEQESTKDNSLEQIIITCLMIFIELHTSPTQLSQKLYELADYLLLQMIAQNMLITHESLQTSLIQLKLSNSVVKQRPTILQQLISLRSNYSNSVFVYSVYNHFSLLDLLKYKLSQNDIQKIFCQLINSQLQLLYKYGKENDLQFVVDYHFTDYWMKEFFDFQKQIQRQIKTNLSPSQKAVYPDKIVENAQTFVEFLFQSVNIVFQYYLDQINKGVQNLDQYIILFIETLLSQFDVIKSKQEYLVQLATLISSSFELTLASIQSTQQLKSEVFYAALLMYINKCFQISLTNTPQSLSLFRNVNLLLKVASIQILQFPNLREHFYHIYNSYLLHVLDSKSIKFEFKIQVMIFLHTVVTASQKHINTFITIFDINKQIPLIRTTLQILIKNMTVSVPLVQRIQLKSFPIQTQFYYDKDIEIDAPIIDTQKLVILTDEQDLFFMILGRFMRMIKDTSFVTDINIKKQFELISCCMVFNAEPEKVEKAFNVFQRFGFVGCKADEIANFIIKNYKQLNPTNIGQLFGGRDTINVSILDAYASLIFLQIKQKASNNLAEFYIFALRNFLLYFKLPGESQQINRIMEKFAEHFSKYQTTIDQQTAYVLSYATLMLNTDMHNYSVNVKMTKEGFVKNTKNADKKDQLSQQFLQDMYDEIQLKPITLDEIEMQRAIALHGDAGFYKYICEMILKQLVGEFKNIFVAPEEQIMVLPSFAVGNDVSQQHEGETTNQDLEQTTDGDLMSEVNTIEQVLAAVEQSKQDDEEKKHGSASTNQIKADVVEQSGSRVDVSEPVGIAVNAQEPVVINDNIINNSLNELVQEDDPSEVKIENVEVYGSNYQNEFIGEKSSFNAPNISTVDDIFDSLHISNNVLNVSVNMFEFIYEDVFNEFIKYVNTTLIQKRYQSYSEFVFLLFRLATVHVNCKHFRSVLLNRMAINVHIALSSFCPYSQYIVDNMVQMDFSKIESLPDTLSSCNKQVSEDLCMGIVLITLVDPFVSQGSYDLLLPAYFNSITLIQTFNVYKNTITDSIKDNFVITKTTKDKIQEIYYFEHFIQLFLKRLQILADIYKKQGENRFFQGHIFRYGDNFKVTKTLLGLLEFYTIDIDRFNNYLQMYTKIQHPISFLCINQVVATISDMFYMVMTYNGRTNRFYFDQQSNIEDNRNNMLIQVIYQYCSQPINVSNLYSLCTSYLQDAYNVIGSLFAYSRYYSGFGTFQQIFSKQIVQLSQKFTSVMEFLQVSPNEYFVYILNNFSHLAKLSQSPPGLSELINFVLTQITQFNDRFIKYEFVVPFLNRALIRPLEQPLPVVDMQNQSLFQCKQSHLGNCGFQLIHPHFDLQQHQGNYINNFDWTESLGQLQTLLQFLPNVTHYLTDTNCLIYFDQLIQVTKAYSNQQIITMVMRCCDLTLTRLYQLQNNDLVEGCTQLVQEVILGTMIDKSLANKLEALQQASSSFNQIVHKIIYEEQMPYWSDLETKRRVLSLLFDKPIKAIILQQRKDKQYSLLDALSINLYEVYHNQKQVQKTACLKILDELIQLSAMFLSTKLPNFDKFKSLTLDTFKNLFSSYQEGNEKSLHDTVFKSVSLITNNLSTSEPILSDDAQVVDFNLKVMYLVEFMKSLDDILSGCSKLSNKTMLEFYEISFNALDNIYVQIADTQTRYMENQSILTLVDFFLHQTSCCIQYDGDLKYTKNYFNSSGFRIFLKLADILIYYQNSANSKLYIDLCIEYLNVAKEILGKFQQLSKQKQLFTVIIQFSMFHNAEIRQFFFSYLVSFGEHVLDRVIK